MDKAIEVGRSSARGSFQLFIGQIISTVLLAVGTIILQLVIPDKDYGLYAIALIPATTILLFQDWGIGSAIVKNCAKCRAENNLAGARQVILSGFAFEIIAGTIFSLFAFFSANYIAALINRPEAAFLIAVASLSVFTTALFATAYSSFIGFERMDLYAVGLVCHGLIQCILAPLLVFFGFGALGALLGYILGYLVAGLLSICLLYFIILRRICAPKITASLVKNTLKPMLKFGVPLAIGAILAGLLTQFYSFLMAKYVIDAAVIGNYRTANNFAIILTFFLMPVSTVLFPALSKIDPKTEKETLQKVFKSASKYISFLIVPLTILLMVISVPLVETIYGGKWPLASSFLSLYVIVNIFAVFGSIVAFNLLTAVGETKLLMRLYALTLLVGVPIGLLLIPRFGIPGLIVANLVAGLPSMFVSIFKVYRQYGARIDFKASVEILICAVVAGSITYLFLQGLQTIEGLRLIFGVALFSLIYFTLSPLIGVINKVDIATCQALFSNMNAMTILLKLPIRFLELVLEGKQSLVNGALIVKQRLLRVLALKI